MERLNILSGSNSVKLDSGFSISAKKVEVKRPIPGEVARHEADHIIPAGKIISATIIASGNALGTTIPEKMTPAAAAGPAANGHRGTGHDLAVLTEYLGVNLHDGLAAGRAALKGKEEQSYEVASILQERKTIGQADVDEAIQNVENRRQGIYTVEVQISSPQGKTQTYTTESIRGEISIQNDLLALPKAA